MENFLPYSCFRIIDPKCFKNSFDNHCYRNYLQVLTHYHIVPENRQEAAQETKEKLQICSCQEINEILDDCKHKDSGKNY